MGTKRKQLGGCAPLLFLVAAIPLGGLRLAIEVLDVLFDLFQYVLQAGQIFPGVLDAVRRFLTPLLVL